MRFFPFTLAKRHDPTSAFAGSVVFWRQSAGSFKEIAQRKKPWVGVRARLMAIRRKMLGSYRAFSIGP